MSNENTSESTPALSREEMISALFANLVVQHTNMALIFLGRMPHPETGKISRDLDSAKFFIDQLEMIEAKTKGNLDKQEETLLKQSLMSLRMAFVDAVTKPEGEPSPVPEKAASSDAPASARTPEAKADDDESRKKFSKKY